MNYSCLGTRTTLAFQVSDMSINKVPFLGNAMMHGLQDLSSLIRD